MLSEATRAGVFPPPKMPLKAIIVMETADGVDAVCDAGGEINAVSGINGGGNAVGGTGDGVYTVLASIDRKDLETGIKYLAITLLREDSLRPRFAPDLHSKWSMKNSLCAGRDMVHALKLLVGSNGSPF